MSVSVIQSSAAAEDKQRQSESAMIVRPGFDSAASFALLRNMASVFANSTIVPAVYRGNAGNALIACHIAGRLGVDPLTIMQNLFPINGRPSWSSQFLISLWNSCGRFSPMRFEWVPGENNLKGCRAFSTDLATGEKLIGTTITWKMVNGEGWSTKAGSKWQTMPEQMFQYRAAAFLVRVYAPELTLGLSSSEEASELPEVTTAITEQQAAAYQAQMNYFAKEMDGAAKQEVRTEAIGHQEVLKPEVMEAVAEVTNRPLETVVNGTPTAVKAEPIVSVEPVKETQVPATSPDVKPAAPAVTAETVIVSESRGDMVCRETLERMAELMRKLNPPKEVWQGVLAKFGAQKASQLTEAEGGRVLAWIQKRLDEVELDTWSQNATLPAGAREVATAEAAPFR